jgi:hypothetical protein
MRYEYREWISAAVKEGVISKSYKSACVDAFCFYAEREPFINIKTEFLEKNNGTEIFRAYIDRKIIKGLLSERRISESASERLLSFITAKVAAQAATAAAEAADLASYGFEDDDKIENRPKGQCRVCGSLDTKRASQILAEGTSSSIGFGVGSSGSIGVGVGFSKTAQAKKAQELRNKELEESHDGYNKLTRERMAVALGSQTWLILLGEYMGISVVFSVVLCLFASVAMYFALPFIFNRYGNEELYEKGRVDSYSADYWSCLRCGHSWDENR